jgi:2,3-bisphosphoglycerate-dependent phosphoglycerate mutase
MTVVYFVRHAESDHQNRDEMTRGLSPRGLRDCEPITRFLSDKDIHAAYSSPYRRAIETISDFAKGQGLNIRTLDGFREWHRRGDPTVNFDDFCRRHWEDHDYRYADGESLCQVQSRNIAALERILGECKGQNVIVGTHGMALSTVIHYYDPRFGYGDFARLLPLMPMIVKLTFEGMRCVGIEYHAFADGG